MILFATVDLGSNFNSLSGTVGKFSYYTFYNFKKGDGFRPNSEFESKNYFGNFDIKPLLDLCKIESFKDYKTYWEITLTAKNLSNLPYSKIIIQISRKYFFVIIIKNV